jgi:hypothetical protein
VVWPWLEKTTMSRTIKIKFKPKLSEEKTEDFNHVDDDTFIASRRKGMRWAADNAEELKGARPILPPGFNNRLRMNWLLQLAMADLAGGDWPKLARQAAVKLGKERREASEKLRLLAALVPVVLPREEITSGEMVELLRADPTGEWSEFRGHGPITQRQVAAILADFDIFPGVERWDGDAQWSYERHSCGCDSAALFKGYRPRSYAGPLPAAAGTTRTTSCEPEAALPSGSKRGGGIEHPGHLGDTTSGLARGFNCYPSCYPRADGNYK